MEDLSEYKSKVSGYMINKVNGENKVRTMGLKYKCNMK